MAAQIGSADSKPNAALTALVGGASDRRFYRLVLQNTDAPPSKSFVVMVIPTSQADVFDAFCANAAYLRSRGIPVPEVISVWRPQGMALLEDFGDTTMAAAIRGEPGRAPRLFDAAVDLLARLHRCEPSTDFSCPAFSLAFDREKWDYEYHFHVRTWLVSHQWGATPTRGETRALDKAFSWLGKTLARQPRVFTHRDYQSSNLLLRCDESLGLVDFQDARLGLRQYDLASLLYDSYTDLEENERNRLVGLYASLSGGCSSLEEHARLVRLAAIQRKLHDAGAFAYTAHHRGKTDFLQYIAGAVNVATLLMEEFPELRATASILRDYEARSPHRGSA